ncbi:hypothetical protein BHE74_00012007 [Ensete ventricosum]|nr:hypothetical protein BHE74_00012007 [Ensete ventricosum]RZS02390.1 hypothetical protein BHM03_00032431 [Ensete ventricosum]
MGPPFISMAIGGVDRGERVDREAAETSYPGMNLGTCTKADLSHRSIPRQGSVCFQLFVRMVSGARESKVRESLCTVSSTGQGRRTSRRSSRLARLHASYPSDEVASSLRRWVTSHLTVITTLEVLFQSSHLCFLRLLQPYVRSVLRLSSPLRFLPVSFLAASSTFSPVNGRLLTVVACTSFRYSCYLKLWVSLCFGSVVKPWFRMGNRSEFVRT